MLGPKYFLVFSEIRSVPLPKLIYMSPLPTGTQGYQFLLPFQKRGMSGHNAPRNNNKVVL